MPAKFGGPLRLALLISLALSAACAPAGSARAQEDFGALWQDGKAELNGYRLSIGRYGEPRAGEAVMIFVTEPFSRSQLVKLDDPSSNPADAVEVLKLNLVRDFQTGIYDYNTMVSVFSRSEDFAPLKVSMSSAEWCGHVYDELRIRDAGIEEKRFSYFEGETVERTIPGVTGGVLEDNFPILLRGLRGAYLGPGAMKKVRVLPGTFASRLRHRPLEWQVAEIERLGAPERVRVPAGTFDAMVYVVRMPGREGRFHIERDAPHRILRWSWTSALASGAPAFLGGDETGELTGTARLPYWRLHGNGDERLRAEIGLAPVR
jgi:hypothetical protein